MSSVAIALVLVSALLHAVWNAALKQVSDTKAAAILIVFGASLVSGVLAIATGEFALPRAAALPLLVAGLIEGAYFVSLAGAIERLPLQSAYGVSRGLGVLLVWPLSAFFLSEQVSVLSLVGAALLSFGLFVQMRSLPRSSGLVYAVVCALTISMYPLAYKRAIRTGISPYVLFSLSLAMAIPAQLLMLGSARLQRIRSAAGAHWRFLVPCAIACAASFLIFLCALKTTGPAHVSAMRNVSVLFASIFAWTRGETFDRRAVASAVLITFGAILVAF